ncbi:hypothetical protein [Lysinibacillus sp. CTST325]
MSRFAGDANPRGVAQSPLRSTTSYNMYILACHLKHKTTSAMFFVRKRSDSKCFYIRNCSNNSFTVASLLEVYSV